MIASISDLRDVLTSAQLSHTSYADDTIMFVCNRRAYRVELSASNFCYVLRDEHDATMHRFSTTEQFTLVVRVLARYYT